MQTDAVDFSIMLVLGLISSLHCVTMCGPIIAVATAPITAGEARPARPWLGLALWQAQYNLGRGITYTALGVVLALAGTSIGALFPAREVGSAIQLAVGGLLIAATLYLVLRGRVVAAPSGGSRLGKLLGKLITSRRGAGVFALGLLTGLLPCGVLYAAFARALAAESPLEGGWLMLAFWLGTVPLLFGLGFVTGGVFRVVGRRVAAALIVVAMLGTGGWLVYKGVRGMTGKATCCAGGQHAGVIVHDHDHDHVHVHEHEHGRVLV